jgi:4-diphosphocytidyl-2-C-methyl-D-erythritol kinase
MSKRHNKHRFRCFAKINTHLKIVGQREDGYHEIDTIFQSLDLHDILEITTGVAEFRLSCTDSTLPVDESNLVVKAVRMFEMAAGIRVDVEVHLVKNIPVAAGLGGGSSDAAGMLRALNILYDNILPDDAVMGLACRLGSDVPFFLFGGRMRGRGKGELLERLPDEAEKSILLIIAPFQISAAEAYRYFDLTFEDQKSNIRLSDHDLKCKHEEATSWFNDLERGVFAKYSEIRVLKECVLTLGAEEALMTGSGPVVAAKITSGTMARQIANKILGEYNIILTKTQSAEQFKGGFVA